MWSKMISSHLNVTHLHISEKSLNKRGGATTLCAELEFNTILLEVSFV